jgi:hypothetical protein
MPNPALNQEQASAHEEWQRVKYITQAHRYCMQRAGVNMGDAEFSKDEESRFNICMAKHHQAFGIFKQEQNTFKQKLADVVANGKNPYAHFQQE